jgi:diguanylate cyclase (GGDEF)-like protein
MLHLTARETGQLEMRAVIGYTDSRIQKFNFAGSKGYVAKAVRERKPLLINDVQVDPTIRYEGTIPEVRAIQSAIVAPLIQTNEVLGALSLDSSQKSAFTEDDLSLLVSLAATVTAAIRNAQLHAEVQKLALTDSMTNIYNRRGFFEIGRREVERSHRFGRPLSAIMFDIDFFKNVNDTYGHANGDHVLRQISDRISKNIREIDILGRYGGDEFTILLPETDMFVATNVAERLRLSIVDAPFDIDEASLRITISLGVAKTTADTIDLASLLDQADVALYAAKQGGRNRVEVG